jgi:uncharacterized protein YggT (Ycf19 family)
MADQVEEVQTVREPVATGGVAERQVQATTTRVTGGALAARIIWFIAGVILVLLAFRFVLALLGANAANGFANFIYSASHPFVAPFFSLFSYNQQLGTAKVEIYTLVAMAVYAIIAWGLARLVTLNQPRPA